MSLGDRGYDVLGRFDTLAQVYASVGRDQSSDPPPPIGYERIAYFVFDGAVPIQIDPPTSPLAITRRDLPRNQGRTA